MRFLILVIGLALAGAVKAQDMKPLTPEERRVIVDKGTEAPFSGRYYKHRGEGVYRCRQCGAPLYRSQDKFDAGCGWPSFDDEIPGAVRRTTESEGRAASQPEQQTQQPGTQSGSPGAQASGADSTSAAARPGDGMPPAGQAAERGATAIFAGGCFWGVEYMLSKVPGVLKVESGYIGGTTENPTYEEVCSHRTGHAEAVRVLFDPAKVSYETLARLFFEIHDPTQENGQGPDLGDQYRSEIFYTSPAQQATAERLIAELRRKGYDVVTQVTPAGRFWPAEDYHQRYYERKGTQPYCHAYTKRF